MSLRKQFLLIVVVLAGGVWITFWPTVQGEFLEWDDDHNVYQNQHLQELNRENLKWMFADVGRDTRYKAFGWLGWALLHRFFGLNPTAFHAANILLHAVNVILVFLLVQRFLLLAAPRVEPVPLGPIDRDLAIAALAALLWAVHPLRVEPVAWVTGFPYHLAMMFLLAALWLYLAISHDRSAFKQPGYWLMLACYLAAMMSYPLPIGGVAIFLALNVFPFSRLDLSRWRTAFSRETGRVVGELLPLLLISAGMLAVAVYGAHVRVGIHNRPPDLEAFPAFARAMQAAYVWMYYLWKPLAPFGLSPVYPTLVNFDPMEAKFLLSAIALVVGSWWVWQKRASTPSLAAFWLAHLGVLVPVLGVNVLGHSAGDRYSLIHGLVLSLALAYVLAVLSRRRDTDRLLALVGAAVIGCGILSWRQSHVWLNNRAFFAYQVETLPDSGPKALAHFRWGNALLRAEDYAGAERQFALARKVFPQIPLPELPYRHGEVLYALGRFSEAAEQYEAALRLRSDAPEVWYGLVQSRLALQEWEAAAAVCERALQAHPQVGEFHADLARIRQAQGRLEEARAHAREAQRLAGP